MLTSIDDNQAIKPTQVSLHIASSKPFCYIGDLKTSPAHIPSVMAEKLPSRNMFEGFSAAHGSSHNVQPCLRTVP